MGSLMGGGATQAAKSASKSTTSASPTYTKGYANLYAQAQQAAAKPFDPATNKTVAGFTDPQQQAFGQVQSNLGNYQPYMDQAAAFTGQGGAAVTGADISNYMDPYQQSVIDATQQQFNTQNARSDQQLAGNMAQRSAVMGSGRDVAAALQKEAQLNAQNPVIAQLYSQGFQNAQGAAQADKARMLQAGGQYGNLGGMQQQYAGADANALLGIGGMQQGQQQSVNDANSANASAAASYDMDRLAWLAGITQGGAGLSQTTTGSQSQNTQQNSGGSGMGQYVGLGLTALSMFSDERVKDNIEPVGQTFDGQPIYRYNYKGDPTTQIGLLAQDVEQHTPEAVGNLGGIKTVDYHTATQGAVPSGMAAGGAVGGSYVPQGPQIDTSGVTPVQPQQPAEAPQQQQSGGGLGDILGMASNVMGAFGGFAEGGAVRGSYVPKMELNTRGVTPGQAPSLSSVSAPPQSKNAMSDMLDTYKQATGAVKDMGGLFKQANTTTDANGWATTSQPQSASGWGNWLGNGGLGGMFSGLGFAKGGAVDDAGVGDVFANLDALGSPVMAQPQPDVVRPLVQPTETGSIAAVPQAPDAPVENPGLLGLFNPSMQQGLMAAGLGMMGSSSNNPFTSIGEGGLKGLGAYREAQQAEALAAQRKQQMDHQAAELRQRQAAAVQRMQMDRERMDMQKAQHSDMSAYRAIQAKKLESDIARSNTQAPGAMDGARVEQLKLLKIDPDSVEGKTFRATGKLSADAQKLMQTHDMRKKAGVKIAGGLNNLKTMMTEKYQAPDIENALGPYQGAEPDGFFSGTASTIARGAGEALNYLWDGKGDKSLTEIRADVNSNIEALSAAIKPLIRGPGEGPWTDADQARLVAIVGNLAQAGDKDEFVRRLENVKAALKANFDMDIPFDGGMDEPEAPGVAAGAAQAAGGGKWTVQEVKP